MSECKHIGSCTIDKKTGCDGDGSCWLYEEDEDPCDEDDQMVE